MKCAEAVTASGRQYTVIFGWVIIKANIFLFSVRVELNEKLNSSHFQTWPLVNVCTVGSGLSPEFAFHIGTTQQEILCSDVWTTTQKSPEHSGKWEAQQAEGNVHQHWHWPVSPKTLSQFASSSVFLTWAHSEILWSFYQGAGWRKSGKRLQQLTRDVCILRIKSEEYPELHVWKQLQM